MAPLAVELAGTADGSSAKVAMAYLRDWQAWLTDAEVLAEMVSAAAVRTSGLLTDTPLSTHTDLADDSGNGRNWTLLGSASTVDGPLLNVRPEGATVISALPYSLELDASTVAPSPLYQPSCGGSNDPQLWWRVPRSLVGLVLSMRVTVDGADFDPVVSVWGDDGGGFAQLSESGSFKSCATIPGDAQWLFVPTRDTIDDYYLQVGNDSGSPSSGTITVDVRGVPTATASRGSILIADDLDGYPALVFDSDTGELLRAVDLAATEVGDVLPNGAIGIVPASDTQTLSVYTNQAVFVASVDFSPETPLVVRGVLGKWYVATIDGSGSSLYTVFPSGAIGTTTWALSSTQQPNQIAISPDNTIAYWVPTTGTGALVTIKRHDLVNDVPFSNLLTVTGGTLNASAGDMYCPDDGSLLVGFKSTVSPFPEELRRYGADGVLQVAYPLVSNLSVTHLDHYRPDPDGESVFAWIHNATETSSEMRRIRLSDGATGCGRAIPGLSVMSVDDHGGIDTTARSHLSDLPQDPVSLAVQSEHADVSVSAGVSDSERRKSEREYHGEPVSRRRLYVADYAHAHGWCNRGI